MNHASLVTPFGPLTVSGSAAGVSAVQFGRVRGKLAESCVQEWCAAIARELAGGPPANVPLDVCGTPFQLDVWAAVARIPRGHTTTYAALAQALGRPRAVRAVANAVAANPVCVVVPCHRVIGTDGTLRGFRWGVRRKQKLLDWERGP